MLSLLGIQECCYFTRFRGCFAEVPHQRIEVVHVLVDIASDALLKTCCFTQLKKCFFDCRFQALVFLSETLNTESLKTHWFYMLI